MISRCARPVGGPVGPRRALRSPRRAPVLSIGTFRKEPTVFAYTNRDVGALNAELRQVRRARGELGSPDVRFATKHGPADFAVGDRVQFADTDKGNVGTLTGIDARAGEFPAKLDSGAPSGNAGSATPNTAAGEDEILPGRDGAGEGPAESESAGCAEVREQQAALPEQEWLIPPCVSHDGRDSLGRGLDAASIATAVAGDERVQKATAEPAWLLERAYRDPYKAFIRLEELIKAEGWTGAAERASGLSPSCSAGCLGGMDCLRAARRSWTGRVRPRRAAR